ncbi:hypothetical protein [Brevundimonas sp. TWP3-1-2b1]|uniref:hypothetical protein n=1 Tax=Brevundimonas sp. TWP3-1-2b1 TaxID=2804650 RepID=UPI003CF79317
MIPSLDPVLSMVVADASEGFIVVGFRLPGTKGIQSKSFHVSEALQAQGFISALGKTHDVYVESALQHAAPPPGKRGTAAGASQFSLVSLDFDCTWGKHAETSLPGSPHDLARVLEAAGAPEPSLVLETGGGLLALWQLEEALSLPIGDEARAARARKASANFQQRIRRSAKQTYGFKLDGTGDLNRLIRVTGTLNHKYDPPRPVRILT